MKKVLNRNHLKLIALLTMVIDHVGFYFVNDNPVMRVIGRIAFPIFAFFIAQGYFYTRNRKKYVFYILLFGLLSQYPHFLIVQRPELNIMFTFLLSILLIYLIEENSKNKTAFSQTLLILYNLALIIIYSFNIISYGFFGVYIPVVFSFVKNNIAKYSLFTLLIFLMTLPAILYNPHTFYTYIQLFAVLAIPILLLYNGQKGKLNLKYLFYFFYPTHLLLLYLIKHLF